MSRSSDFDPPLLLLRLQPLPDEWMGSWIVRLSMANYTESSGNPLEFLKALKIDSIEQQLTAEQLFNLSKATAVDITTLQSMNTLPTDLIRQIGHIRGGFLPPTPFFGVRHFVVCPICLKEDHIPYFRRTWLRWSTIACSTHGGPLYDTCPHCDSRLCIRLSPLLKRKKRQTPQGYEHRVLADLRRCWNCNGDIAVQVTQLVNLPTTFRDLPYQMIRKEDIDLAAWQSFIQSLKFIIINYNLDHMIDPDFSKPNFLHRFDWRGSMAANARFHIEEVLTWLVTFPEDQSLNLDQRFEYIGTVLLGLAIRDDNDYRRTSLRELHIAWLGIRLTSITPQIVLYDWIIYTRVLVSLHRDRCNDPRPRLDNNFVVNEALWQVIISSMGKNFLEVNFGINPPTTSEMREALGHTLQLIAGVPKSKMPTSRMTRVHLANLISVFKKSENISCILQQLYFLITQYRSSLLSPELAEPTWIEPVVSILISDKCIDLTKDLCPKLHHDLLSELVYGVKQANPNLSF